MHSLHTAQSLLFQSDLTEQNLWAGRRLKKAAQVEAKAAVQATADARDPLAQQPSCRYRKLGSLNNGSSGFVQLAEDMNTKQKVAIKFLERGTKIIRDADREICNLRLCCMHPFIIRFKEVRILAQAPASSAQ